jgi:hypothetical protein
MMANNDEKLRPHFEKCETGISSNLYKCIFEHIDFQSTFIINTIGNYLISRPYLGSLCLKTSTDDPHREAPRT